MGYPTKNTLFKGIVFLCLFTFFTEGIYAQCAGADFTTADICDKYTDTSLQTYDLYALLEANASPTAGGTWTADTIEDFRALDMTTGVVNLWEIHTFGNHNFTYNDPCGDPIVVTVPLGAFPGVDNINGTANACSDNTAVNLHGFIGDNDPLFIQDFNGTWSTTEPDISVTDLLTNQGIFDASTVPTGEQYLFTYTVEAVGTCPGASVDLLLGVRRKPESGTPTGIVMCVTDDFSALTNLNLFDQLEGEDTDGVWTDTAGTGEIPAGEFADHHINVERIRDTFGWGSYNFNYFVKRKHGVCDDAMADVLIEIQPTLRGNIDIPHLCHEDDLTFTLNYDNLLTTPGGAPIFDDGTYDIVFEFDDGRIDPYRRTFSSHPFSGGTATFSFDTADLNDDEDLITTDFLETNRRIEVSIVSIVKTGGGFTICDDILVADTFFVKSTPSASPAQADACFNTAAGVRLNNIFDNVDALASGTQQVQYTMTDPDGTVHAAETVDVAFTNGSGEISFEADELPILGLYRFSITAQNSISGCEIMTSFEVLPIPPEIDLAIDLDSGCDATSLEISYDAPVLAEVMPPARYVITWTITELGSTTALITDSVTITDGTDTEDVDISSLDDGDYTITVTSVQDDDGTPCRTSLTFEETTNFSLGSSLPAPTAESRQEFCTLTFGMTPPTLADLEVESEGMVAFYATEDSEDILPIDTQLNHGDIYYAANTGDAGSICDESTRISIEIAILTPGNITAIETAPVICSSENPTVGSLQGTVSEGSLVWYDALMGGAEIPAETTLVSGQSYFADVRSGEGCENGTRTEVIPTIVSPAAPLLSASSLSLCVLDNPTAQELIDLVTDNGTQIVWYDAETAGTVVSAADLLVDGQTYYAESTDATSGCTNPTRVAVTTDLSNCNPDDYGFFVPDAFSPNADGRNDTFFVPNIGVFYPNYTIDIYNRYGTSMFSGNIKNSEWDGTMNGNTAPNGVYFYVIHYNQNGQEPVQGILYLNR